MAKTGSRRPSADIASPDIVPKALTFEAVLYPNQSLGKKGFAILMGLIVLVSLLVGAGFALAGAWPIADFLGLDVLLLYFAFRLQFRDASRADFIRIDGQSLCVRRLMPNRKDREWRFDIAWVQIVVEEKRLLLRSHGEELMIGAYLTVDERLSLADALKQAVGDRQEAMAAS